MGINLSLIGAKDVISALVAGLELKSYSLFICRSLLVIERWDLYCIKRIITVIGGRKTVLDYWYHFSVILVSLLCYMLNMRG